MYLKKLQVRNVKRIQSLDLDFTHQRRPRHFTVFLGENGLCKTALLQVIALAASGVERANQLADVASFPDIRHPQSPLAIDATFSFSASKHRQRLYGRGTYADEPPPTLQSTLQVRPGYDLFGGESFFINHKGRREEIPEHVGLYSGSKRIWKPDPLTDARGANTPHWFVAGYGVGRTLPAPASVTQNELSSPSRDRLASLFTVSKRIVGTGFADLLPVEQAETFVALLREVFVQHRILPKEAINLDLQTRGSVSNTDDRLFAHRLTMAYPKSRFDVPTSWLSQGYQATMAWIADLVGQLWWDSQAPVTSLKEMEGICLVDELDLHLHPYWQSQIVRGLKSAFPRIQFITTTHSPMVLSGLEQHEIICLEMDEQGDVKAKPATESPKLLTGSEIYRSFFGIDRPLPRELDDALFCYGSLANFAGRSDDEDREMRAAVVLLKKHGIDPGYSPVPRDNE